MSIERITPRMIKALRDSKPLAFFADIWSSVLNDAVDTQEEWKSSDILENIDTDFNPGFARLAIQEGIYNINQTTHNASSSLYAPYLFSQLYQGFRIFPSRELSAITIRVDASGASASGHIALRVISNLQFTRINDRENLPSYTLLGSIAVPFTAGFNGDIRVVFPNPIPLLTGDYWINCSLDWQSITGVYVRYQNSDAYADGYLTTQPFAILYYGDPTYNIGDMYFKLELSGFKSSGRIVTRTLNLGESPRNTGQFKISYALPVGTSFSAQLTGSASEDMSSPTIISGANDGTVLPVGLQYWKADMTLLPNADLSATPEIDKLEVIYPKNRTLLREKGKGFFHLTGDLLTEYQALLTPMDFQMSAIKVIERVSAGGDISCDLEDPTGDIIYRLMSDSPLLNFTGKIYLGADVPDFRESDLLEFWNGSISAVSYKPKYRNASAIVTLKFKNPVLDLKRKIPQPQETGLLSFDTIALNYDAWHVIDTMIDMCRSKASIPARNVNVDSFLSVKSQIGPLFLIRRSNAAGLPDTRITDPDELQKFLGECAIIADVYVVPDESSRITCILHDKNAPAEGDPWADETMVRELGVDAVPIEAVDAIDLGYDALLYNAAFLGCEWDGTTDEWTGFGKTYCNINASSVNQFAPGHDIYLSIMEKNMKEASKWLGPESGYNGETIAQLLTQRYTDRFAFPPVVMTGVRVPNSEFIRTLGSVVKVWSKEFVKLGLRGISTSETKKFMVMSKKYDRAKNRMLFDLLELT